MKINYQVECFMQYQELGLHRSIVILREQPIFAPLEVVF